jgi:hypothetical protein
MPEAWRVEARDGWSGCVAHLPAAGRRAGRHPCRKRRTLAAHAAAVACCGSVEHPPQAPDAGRPGPAPPRRRLTRSHERVLARLHPRAPHGLAGRLGARLLLLAGAARVTVQLGVRGLQRVGADVPGRQRFRASRTWAVLLRPPHTPPTEDSAVRPASREVSSQRSSRGPITLEPHDPGCKERRHWLLCSALRGYRPQACAPHPAGPGMQPADTQRAAAANHCRCHRLGPPRELLTSWMRSSAARKPASSSCSSVRGAAQEMHGAGLPASGDAARGPLAADTSGRPCSATQSRQKSLVHSLQYL